MHTDTKALNTYLQKCNYSDKVGPYLNSELFCTGAKNYQHLEYDPVINSRAHKVGNRSQISTKKLKTQYFKFVTNLAYKDSLDDDDRLSLTYYLLLQDRIDEAIKMFSTVDIMGNDDLTCQLQYDYISAYLDFFNTDITLARDIAEKYVDYPLPDWDKKFKNIRSQISDIDDNTFTIDGEDDKQEKLKGIYCFRLLTVEKHFSYDIFEDQIHLEHRNLDSEEAKLKVYMMDIELLFSSSPFMKKDLGQFSFIKPNIQEMISLKRKHEGEVPEEPERKRLKISKTVIDLPEKCKNKNVMIELSAEDDELSKVVPNFSNNLDVILYPRKGLLRVCTKDTDVPLPGCYIKVFAKSTAEKFHKDGYTDLRGVFDYRTTRNCNKSVNKFAILILTETHGSTIKEVDNKY